MEQISCVSYLQFPERNDAHPCDGCPGIRFSFPSALCFTPSPWLFWGQLTLNILWLVILNTVTHQNCLQRPLVMAILNPSSRNFISVNPWGNFQASASRILISGSTRGHRVRACSLEGWQTPTVAKAQHLWVSTGSRGQGTVQTALDLRRNGVTHRHLKMEMLFTNT